MKDAVSRVFPEPANQRAYLVTVFRERRRS